MLKVHVYVHNKNSPGISKKFDVLRCWLRTHWSGVGSPASESRLDRREAKRAKLPVAAPDRLLEE